MNCKESTDRSIYFFFSTMINGYFSIMILFRLGNSISIRIEFKNSFRVFDLSTPEIDSKFIKHPMNFFFIWLDSVYLVCTQHKMGVYSIFIIEWLFDSFSSFDHKKIKTSRILLICRKNSLILPFWWNRNSSPYSLIYYSICMKSNILFGWNPIGFQYFLLLIPIKKKEFE